MGQRQLLLTTILSAIITSTSASPLHQGSPMPSAEEVRHALAARSGVPEPELQALLTHCDAAQRNMEFCAYRDFVAVDLQFKRAMSLKQQQFPACASNIAAQVNSWEIKRDKGCANGAATEYGNGSLRNTAQAICATDETNRMMHRLATIQTCSNPN